jgi:hypothetical protein
MWQEAWRVTFKLEAGKPKKEVEKDGAHHILDPWGCQQKSSIDNERPSVSGASAICRFGAPVALRRVRRFVILDGLRFAHQGANTGFGQFKAWLSKFSGDRRAHQARGGRHLFKSGRRR